jgi:hypothetical protein
MRFASDGHTLKSAGWRLMFSEVLAVAQIVSGDDHGFYFRVGRLSSSEFKSKNRSSRICRDG